MKGVKGGEGFVFGRCPEEIMGHTISNPADTKTPTGPKARPVRLFGVLLIVGFALLSVSSGANRNTGPDSLKRFTFTEYHMGVDTRLVVYSPNEKSAIDGCAAAFERIAALDTIMSDYRRDSELMRLCDKAGTGPVHVSPDLFRVLTMSQRIAQMSDGMFDVTVGPVVQLWRKARKTAVAPTPDEIESARRLVGWQKLKLDPKASTVELALPGMKLDLGAIGKGYADDEAQKVLKKHGITRALVEMGGDIVVSGPPPGTDGWTIRVPDAGKNNEPVDMHLSNCAISTSGDAEQFVVIGGVRYSHVVNPHTGYALKNSVEATIIARDGLTSDPVSTALTLVDEKGRARLLKAYPVSKVYIRKPGPSDPD